MPEAISLKFGMWSTEVGGNVHSKICLVSCFIKAAQSYGGAKIAFSFFLSIYSRGFAPASWAARHTTVCLDNVILYSMSRLTIRMRSRTRMRGRCHIAGDGEKRE